ncbi:MAG TPA: hypothetical protein VN253_10190 [Kofleriaceae bacterium]|nr:hypothetical protein [Kofleriaceae bacterium]
MNWRGSDFAGAIRGWLAAFGPGVRSVSVQRIATWTIVKIGVVNDRVLRQIAADLGLDQARTAWRGRVWYRQAYSTADGVIVVAVGPAHEGEDPEGWTMAVRTAKRSLPS